MVVAANQAKSIEHATTKPLQSQANPPGSYRTSSSKTTSGSFCPCFTCWAIGLSWNPFPSRNSTDTPHHLASSCLAAAGGSKCGLNKFVGWLPLCAINMLKSSIPPTKMGKQGLSSVFFRITVVNGRPIRGSHADGPGDVGDTWVLGGTVAT